MQTPKESITVLKSMVKTTMLPYVKSCLEKESYLKIRRKLITDLRNTIQNEVVIINKEEVFYLAVTYIDIILLSNSNRFNVSILQIHDGIIFSCLSLSMKIIGKLTNRNAYKLFFSSKLLMEYETRCLKCLDYRLIYSTPYDFIKLMFHSNEKMFCTAKTILASFAFNDTYINYPSSIIAFGIINYSIEIIGIAQKYLIAFDRYIHSPEANALKNELKHFELKKRKCSQMKTMENTNINKDLFNKKEEPYVLSTSSSRIVKQNKNKYESDGTSSSTLSNSSNSNSPTKRHENVRKENGLLYNSSMNSLSHKDNNVTLNYKQFSSINIANMSYLTKNYLSNNSNSRYFNK